MNKIIALSLSIPVLNFITGPILGLVVLSTLIKSSEFKAIVPGLFYAILWCVIGSSQFYFLTKNHGPVLMNFVIFIVHYIYSLWFLNWVDEISSSKITNQFKKFKNEYSLTNEFVEISKSSNGICILCDLEKKLLAFVYKDGYIVKPYSYIKQWSLEWESEQVGSQLFYKKVRMCMITTDINTPRIIVSLDSKKDGENLNARLLILLG